MQNVSFQGLISILPILCAWAQSWPTLCHTKDCSPPSSSVHRIFEERILEWVAISSSRGSSQPRDQTCITPIGRQILYQWLYALYDWYFTTCLCVAQYGSLTQKVVPTFKRNFSWSYQFKEILLCVTTPLKEAIVKT